MQATGGAVGATGERTQGKKSQEYTRCSGEGPPPAEGSGVSYGRPAGSFQRRDKLPHLRKARRFGYGRGSVSAAQAEGP